MKKHKLIAGVGINDADYNISGCPYYARWACMIRRCYDPYHLNKTKAYRDCLVCEEWLTFSNFRKWMIDKDWDGKHLDKDILIKGNKIYSPDACVFVSSDTNRFILEKYQDNGSLVGAIYYKKRNIWKSDISVKGRTVFLGHFKSEIEAHNAYKLKKYELAKAVCELEPDDRVRSAILERYIC